MIDTVQNEKSEGANFKKSKHILLATLYLFVAVVCVLALFVKFLNVTNLDGIPSGLKNDYTFQYLLSRLGGAEKGNVVGAIVLFVTGAAIALGNFVITVMVLLKNGKSGKALKWTKFSFFLLFVIVFATCYSAMISVQFHFLTYLAGSGEIGAFFVVNILLPLVLLATLATDNFNDIKQILPKRLRTKELFPTTFVYPMIFVLAIVTLALPVYQYVITFESIKSMPTEMLSLYGFNEISSMLNFRTAFLLVGCLLAAITLFGANIGALMAKENGNEKIFKTMKIIRLSVCIAFALLFVFCISAVINFQTHCSERLADMPGEMYSGMTKGIAFYAMLILPILTLVIVAFDGIHEYRHIHEKLVYVQSRNQPKMPASKKLVNSLFSAAYMVVFFLIFLAVSLPYAQYNVKDFPDVTFFMYVMNYKGVSGFEYIQGLPTTDNLHIYALLTILAIVVSFAMTVINSKKSASNPKLFEKINFITKGSCALAFTVVFVIFQRYLPFYLTELQNTAQIADFHVILSPVPVFFSIGAIVFFTLSWIEVLMCLWHRSRN